MNDNERTGPRPGAASWASNRMVWVGGTIIAALILVIVVLAVVGDNGVGEQPGQEIPSQGNQHIAEVGSPHPEYNSDPPTSGWHVGRLARWGSYDYELPDELLIHNMEDGGVILWYPLGSQEQNQEHIARLEQAARGYSRVVIVPRDTLEDEYALTAWTRLDRFAVDQYSEERVRAFLEAYEGIDHH